MSLAMISGALGRLFWGFVSDNWLSPRKVLGLLGIVMSTSALLTGHITEEWSVPLVYFLSIIFGGSAVGWNGVYLAEVTNIVGPKEAGAVTGGTLTITYAGVVIFPLLFWVVHIFTRSYSLPFILISIATLVTGYFFLLPLKRQ